MIYVDTLLLTEEKRQDWESLVLYFMHKKYQKFQISASVFLHILRTNFVPINKRSLLFNEKGNSKLWLVVCREALFSLWTYIKRNFEVTESNQKKNHNCKNVSLIRA